MGVKCFMFKIICYLICVRIQKLFLAFIFLKVSQRILAKKCLLVLLFACFFVCNNLKNHKQICIKFHAGNFRSLLWMNCNIR
jgi:hypothetical protein